MDTFIHLEVVNLKNDEQFGRLNDNSILPKGYF